MKNYYEILKCCVDDTIHPSHTEYLGDEIKINAGVNWVRLKTDDRGNLSYKYKTTKGELNNWILIDKISMLTSTINSSFGSYSFEYSQYLRWIYQKYVDALNVGLENRVWSMSFFYDLRMILNDRLKDKLTNMKLTSLTVSLKNNDGGSVEIPVQFNYQRGSLFIDIIEFSAHSDMECIQQKINQLRNKYNQLVKEPFDKFLECILEAYRLGLPGNKMSYPDKQNNPGTSSGIQLQTYCKTGTADLSLMSKIFAELTKSNDWLQLGDDLTFRCTKDGDKDTFITFCHESAPDGGTLLKYIREDIEWISEYTINLDIDNLQAKGDELILPLLQQVVEPNVIQRICTPLTENILSVSYVDYLREEGQPCYRLLIDESIGQTVLKSVGVSNDKFTVRSNFINTPDQEMSLDEFLNWAATATLNTAVNLSTAVKLLNRLYK